MSPATARSDSSRATLLTFSGEEQPPEPGEPNGWDELPASTATSEPLHRLLALVGEDRGRVVRGTLLQAGQALSHIPFTAGVGLFIDHILPTSDLRLVAAYFIANLLLLPIHGWFTVEAFRVSEELVRGAISRVQTALVVQLQRMRLDFFVHRGAGTLANQLTVDLERLQRFLEHAANAFVVNLVVGAATLIYLTFLNWRLALVALVAIPLQLALVQLFVGESKQLSSRAQRAGEGFTSRIVEFVFGMRLVKSFGNERLAANKLRSKIRRLERERVDASVALRRLLMRSHMVGMAVPVVVWSLGAYLHFRGSVTVGELVAFVGLLAFVQNGFTAFSDTYQQWIAARPGLESLFSVLDSQEQEGAQLEEDIEHLEGTIELRDVDFRYAGSESPLFEGLALTVPRGQRVALVGPSGAGKSTFLDLMLGFRDVSGGQIRIGGREFSPALRLALRRRTATMGQDAFLFNTTILENIRFGRPGASDQECIEAARRARVDEFVQRLPEGYASSCGEQGSRLSGGQRQRVALARLFLRDPDIVILDEPTSALDVETEARLLEDLEEFCEGRTTFVVAHRLSTIRLCQRVLVFQDGKIVEDGSPEALRNRPDSFFAQLWELQSGRRPPRESGESLIA